jgi:hypothetical protein
MHEGPANVRIINFAKTLSCKWLAWGIIGKNNAEQKNHQSASRGTVNFHLGPVL